MSSALTRDEAIDRQELDDGDPEDVVLVTTNKRSSSFVYHEDEDCQALKSRDDITLREYTRERAQDRWLGPCKHCVLEGER